MAESDRIQTRNHLILPTSYNRRKANIQFEDRKMVDINAIIAFVTLYAVSMAYGQSASLCTPTNAACAIKSVPINGKYSNNELGRGYTYYKYFSELAHTYCPVSGSYKYADCYAACHGDVDFEKCVECCGSCCPAPQQPVCSSTDQSCATTSQASGTGYDSNAGHGGSSSQGHSYYTYFSQSQSIYCPVSGSRKYADCAAACRGDIKLVECMRCCGSCCPSNNKSKRYR